MFIVTIWTTALLMFIHCKMAPGTHATENQAAGSVVLRLRHRLENLSWEMNDHLHPVPHVENLSWKMNPASSEESYDGHVAVQPTSVPTCRPRHQDRHHHRGLRPYYPYRHGLLVVDDLNTMLSRAMQSLLWPGMKQDAATTEGYVITFILFPTLLRLMVTGGGRASTVPAWLPGYLRGNPARKGLVDAAIVRTHVHSLPCS